MFLLVLILLSVHLHAEHPYTLAALEHDKALLLASYHAELSTIADSYAPASEPCTNALTSLTALREANTMTSAQNLTISQSLISRFLSLSWLDSQISHSRTHDILIQHSLSQGRTRISRALSRAAATQKSLTSLNEKVAGLLTRSQHTVTELESRYDDVRLLALETEALMQHAQLQQVNALQDYHHSLHAHFAYPTSSSLAKSFRLLIPFSHDVPSPVAGVVLLSKPIPGMGQCILVDHDGAYTLISGLSDTLIKRGGFVSLGTKLGELHGTAYSVTVTTWPKRETE